MLKPVIVMTCAVVSAVLAGVGFMGLDNHTPPDAAPSEPPVSAAVADNPGDTTSDTHITAIPKAADGHFWANATVNDKAVRFLVDTGATVVVLTEADAQRLGIDKTTLVFDHKVVTAMGPTQAAKVTLSTIGVGQSTVHDVDALIIPQGGTSLLGMSFLGRLSRFEATPSSLILHP
ncbi:MAG: TIGR02281 family clan AA aspartic protease [Asticcacaulis sp.]